MNMWKTVSARIRGADTELKEMGEDTDGMVTSSSKLQALIKGMTGFDIMESDGKTFKDIYDIIIGIGEKWNDLSDINRASLLEKLAGKNQSNALAAAISQVDVLKKSYKEATNAEGSAREENEEYAKSIQASIDLAQAKLEELANDLLSSDFLKGLIDSGGTALDIINGLFNGLQNISSLGGNISSLGGILGTVGGLVQSFTGHGAVQYDKENGWSGIIVDIYKAKKGIVDLGDEFKKIKENANSKGWNFEYFYNSHNKDEIEQWIKQLDLSDESLKKFLKDWDGSGDIQEAFTAHMKESTEGLTLFQRAGKAAGGVIKSLGATLGSMAAAWAIGEAISLAINGIDAIINHAKRASDAAQEAKEKASNTLSEDEETSNSLDDLISKYKELRESSDYDETKRKDVLEIQDQITDLVGTQASNLDLVNGKLDDQLSKLKTLSKEQRKKTLDSASNAYHASKDASNKLAGAESDGGLFGLGIGAVYHDVAIDTSNDAAEALMSLKGTKYNDVFFQSRNNNGKIIVDAVGNNAKEKEKYLQGIIDTLQKNGLTNNKLFTGISAAIGKYTDAQNEDYKNAKKYVTTKLDTDMPDSSKINSLDDFEKKRKQIIDDLQKDDTITEAIKNGDLNKDDLAQTVDSWISTCEGFSDWYGKWKNKTTKTANNSDSKTKSFDEVWSGLKESEQNKFTKLVNNGKLTAETFDKIGSSATALKETGLSVEDLCDKIRSLVGLEQKLTNLSNSMKKVGTAYKDYKKNGYVSSTSLNSMPDSFKNLDGYSKFSKIAGSKKSSKSDIQGAFNDIVTEYVSTSNILDDVTEKNKNKVITALRDAGIINAKKVVDTFLNSSDEQFSKLSSKFNKMSNSELQNFIKMLNQKGKVSGDFYKKIGVNNANMINGLSKQYRTDLVNWIKLCEKKRDAYNQLVKAVGGKNTKEAKKNYVKLVTKDESKLTAEDMGKYEYAQKGGIITKTDKKGKVIAATKYDSKQKKLEKKLGLKLAKVNFDVDYKPTSASGGGSKSKSKSSKSTQVIDWIERKLDRLNTKLDLVKAKYDNLPSSSKSSAALLKAENKNLDDQIKILKKVQSVNDKSYSKYMKKANNSATYKTGKGKKKKTYKLSKSLKKKIRNGRIKGSYKKLIATYGEPKANAIQKYQDYYDKAQSSKKNSQDAKKSITDAKVEKLTNAQNYYDTLNAMNQAYESIAKGLSKNNYVQEQIEAIKQSYNYQIKIARAQGDYNKAKQLEQEKEKAILDLQRQKVENIKTFYDNQVGLLDNDKQDIQNRIDLIEARGDIVSKGYYNNLTSEDNAIIAKREAELKDLKSQLSTTDQGTDNWYELQNDIQSVENEINDHKKSVYENTKAIGELNDKMYEAIYAVSSNLNAELDTISSLKRGETSDSDTGTLTDTGLLQLYAAGLSYSATKGTAAEANARLAEIINANKSGKVLEGYTSLQAQKDAEAQLAKDAQDQVTSVKSYGDKIIEIIKDAISSVADHLQEIIDARKEALNEEKDLRDYERSILEKTKNVSSLQKQFMAVSGDTSEEGRLKAAQLRKSLDEAQQDLQDTEYDRYISDQQEMLDNMMNQFQDLMEKLQKDEDALLREGIKAINDQKGVMQQIFNKTAEEYGYPTSTNLTELQTALTTGRITADIINSAKDDSVTSVIKTEVEKIVKAYGDAKSGTGGGTSSTGGGTPSTGGNNSNGGDGGNYTGDTITTNTGNTIKYRDGKTIWGNERSNSVDGWKPTLKRWLEANATGKKKAKVKEAEKGKTYKSDLNNKLSKKFGYILSDKNNGLKEIQKFLNITKNDKDWSSNGYVYKELKDLGCFATGGIAKLVKPAGEDGIGWLRNGEGLVAPENVQDIRDLMAVTPDLTKFVASFSNLPNVKPLDKNVTRNVSIDNITFDMPNVTNATDFTDTIKKPEQQKAFAAAIGDAFNGKKLNINRY